MHFGFYYMQCIFICCDYFFSSLLYQTISGIYVVRLVSFFVYVCFYFVVKNNMNMFSVASVCEFASSVLIFCCVLLLMFFLKKQKKHWLAINIEKAVAALVKATAPHKECNINISIQIIKTSRE